MKKEQYKELLIDMLEEMPDVSSGHYEEIIYKIDELKVYGAFDCGSRGVDHNILLFDGVEWEDVLEWGTLVVPENTCYISEDPVELFDAVGYDRLPLNNNHIVGHNNN